MAICNQSDQISETKMHIIYHGPHAKTYSGSFKQEMADCRDQIKVHAHLTKAQKAGGNFLQQTGALLWPWSQSTALWLSISSPYENKGKCKSDGNRSLDGFVHRANKQWNSPSKFKQCSCIVHDTHHMSRITAFILNYIQIIGK